MTDAPPGDQVPATVGADQPSTSAPAPAPVSDVDLLKEFFSELKDVDRDNEVNRILWAFKLNPFEKLGLRFDATAEDVKRQYRKSSLMVHPDKCAHPQASAAFEALSQAQRDLLDEGFREGLMIALNHAREEVRKERRKEVKHDAAVRVASLLNEAGREGVEAAWEASDEFHERWKAKAREVLANTEWRKRKITKRIADETERGKAERAEEKERAKKKKAEEKDWEEQREARVGTWRDFAKGGKGAKATGELKPPKLKTEDADKRYVQRAVGEQWRPPPAKPQKR